MLKKKITNGILILTSSILHFGNNSFAQTGNATPKSTSQNVEATSNANSLTIEQISSGFSGSSSINESGDLNVSIPLVTASGRKLVLPLNLNYSAGIKADQKSSEVGLGWSLQFGSIVRDYGAFEPDYSAVNGEMSMENSDPAILGSELTVTGEHNSSTFHNNKSLIYNMIDNPNYGMIPDKYHVIMPGAGGGTFWNKNQGFPTQQFIFENSAPWKVNFNVKTFEVSQEFSRINEYNYIPGVNDITNGGVLNHGGSFAAAICIPPYVNNRQFDKYVADYVSATNTNPDLNNRSVKYEDFSKFEIITEDGTRYIFGRPLRGQKYLFNEDPYWSTLNDQNQLSNEAVRGEWWKIDFIAEWLLTEVLSVDYIDANGNGIADEGDEGDWIRIEYTKLTQSEPLMIGATMIAMSEVPSHREWSNFSSTDRASSLMRERAYVTKIVTPVQEIDFTSSPKMDVDFDYFSKPANNINQNFVYEDLKYNSTGSITDFDIFYPVEIMKYDQIQIRENIKDDAEYIRNDKTSTIKLEYAEKGSNEELGVSNYLIRDNNNQEIYPYSPSNPGVFDITNFYTANGRGKTTLVGLTIFPENKTNHNQPLKYKFQYGFNPSMNELHKSEIVRNMFFPNVRQSLNYSERIVPFAISYLPEGSNNPINISPYNLLSNLPYNSATYAYDMAQSDREYYVNHSAFSAPPIPEIIENSTNTTFSILDVLGFYNDPVFGLSAWSLAKITYPTGGTLEFEYEADDFDYSSDRNNWTIKDDELGLIAEYNSIAKAMSLRQDAVNKVQCQNGDLNNWQSPLPLKTLPHSFHMNFNSKGGIRLKKKIMNDGINPIQEVTYTYGTGHYTAPPAEYWQNYIEGFSSFIQQERRRHQGEFQKYIIEMYVSYPSWVKELDEKFIPYFSNIRVGNNINGTHFYDFVEEHYSNGSKLKKSFGHPINRDNNIYNTQNFISAKTGLTPTEDVYMIVQQQENEKIPVLLKEEHFEAGQNLPYSSIEIFYQNLQIFEKNIQSLPFVDWPSATYACYAVKDEIYPSANQNILDLQSGLFPSIPTLNLLIDWEGFGAIDKATVYVPLENLKLVGFDDTKIGSLVRLNQSNRLQKIKEVSNYKGLVNTSEYTYESVHGLLKTSTSNNSQYIDNGTGNLVNEIYITETVYAFEAYSGNNIFLNKNMLVQQAGSKTYLNSVANTNVIGAVAQTWNISLAIPDQSFVFNSTIDQKGVITSFYNFDFTPQAINGYEWQLTGTQLEYNRYGNSLSNKVNQVYSKNTWGFNSGTVKANFNDVFRPFDATYSGFEELYHDHGVIEKYGHYEDEFWYDQNITRGFIPVSAPVVKWNYNGTQLPCTSFGDNGDKVIKVDNYSGQWAVGDKIRIIPDPNIPFPFNQNNSFIPFETEIANITNVSVTFSDIFPFPNAFSPDVLNYTSWENMDFELCFADPLPSDIAIFGALIEKVDDQTTISKHVKSLSHTGEYVYYLSDKLNDPDPAQKSPVRPVEISSFSVWQSICDLDNVAKRIASEIFSEREFVKGELYTVGVLADMTSTKISNRIIQENELYEIQTEVIQLVEQAKTEVLAASRYNSNDQVLALTAKFNEILNYLADNTFAKSRELINQNYPEACKWNYTGSIWIRHAENISDNSGPKEFQISSTRSYVKQIGLAIDPNITYNETLEYDQDIKFIYEIWNADYSQLLQSGFRYFNKPGEQWSYYNMPIPLKKRTENTHLLVYVENNNIKPTGNPNIYKKLFLDDILVYPTGAKYSYSTIDKFGNSTWITDDNENSFQTIFDEWGRPKYSFDGFRDIVSEFSFFITNNINAKHNQTKVKQYLGGTYNEKIALTDGFGKVKQTIVNEPSKNISLVSETVEYDAMGKISRNYKPYPLAGAAFPDKAYSNYITSLNFTYGSAQSFAQNEYFNYPNPVIKKVDAPRMNAEIPINRQFQDNSNTIPITVDARTYPIGSLMEIKITETDGTISYIYKDAAGRTILAKNPIGQNHLVDPTGIIVTDAGSSYEYALTQFTYDAAGHLIKSIDPDLHTSIYQYSSANQMIRETHPDKGISFFKYDKFGQLRFTQDQEDIDVISTGFVADRFNWTKYDKFGRVIESGIIRILNGVSAFGDISKIDDQLYPTSSTTGTEKHMENGYDGSITDNARSKLVYEKAYSDHLLDVNGTYQPQYTDEITYSYDYNGLPVTKTFNIDGISIGHRFNYIYERGNLLKLKEYENPANPDYNFVEKYDYDDWGRIIKCSSGKTVNTLTEDVSFLFDALGNLSKTSLAPTGNSANPYHEYVAYNYNIRNQQVAQLSLRFKNLLEYNSKGMITRQLWNNNHFDNQSGGNYTQHIYDYFYDDMNRLAGANYIELQTTNNPFSTIENNLNITPPTVICSPLVFLHVKSALQKIEQIKDSLQIDTAQLSESSVNRLMQKVNILEQELNNAGQQGQTPEMIEALLKELFYEVREAETDANETALLNQQLTGLVTGAIDEESALSAINLFTQLANKQVATTGSNLRTDTLNTVVVDTSSVVVNQIYNENKRSSKTKSADKAEEIIAGNQQTNAQKLNAVNNEAALRQKEMQVLREILKEVKISSAKNCYINSASLAYNTLAPDALVNPVYQTGQKYDAAFWYTKNGNFTQLNRFNDMAELTTQLYNYSGNNRLTSVNWNENGNQSSTAYSYDAVGNLTSDQRSNVSNLAYNGFHYLPVSISKSNGTVHKYRYSGGERRMKEVSATDKEYYLDGVIVDQTGKPKRYSITNGYATIDVNNVIFKNYVISDWLGTPRIIIDQNGIITSTRDHYPFGKAMPGRVFESDVEGARYQFDGHERDGETGYDYHGFRYYNNELGRYLSVDLLAAKYPHQSPYSAFNNNPIFFTDPRGLAGEPAPIFVSFLMAGGNPHGAGYGMMKIMESTVDGMTYVASSLWASVVAGVTYGYGDMKNGHGESTQITLSAYGFTFRRGFQAEKAEIGQTVSFNNGMRMIGGVIDFVSLGMTWTQFGNQVRRLGGSYSLAYSGYGGNVLIDPKATTTILGSGRNGWASSLKSEMKNFEGLDFLDVDDNLWKATIKEGGENLAWTRYNKPFIDKAINSGNKIRLVSDPTNPINLYKNGVDATGGTTMFGREVEYLKSKGYSFKNGYAVK